MLFTMLTALRWHFYLLTSHTDGRLNGMPSLKNAVWLVRAQKKAVQVAVIANNDCAGKCRTIPLMQLLG